MKNLNEIVKFLRETNLRTWNKKVYGGAQKSIYVNGEKKEISKEVADFLTFKSIGGLAYYERSINLSTLVNNAVEAKAISFKEIEKSVIETFNDWGETLEQDLLKDTYTCMITDFLDGLRNNHFKHFGNIYCLKDEEEALREKMLIAIEEYNQFIKH